MEEKSYKEYLEHITTFIFDVDGVLTDGSVTVLQDGDMLRRMNVKDGYAMKEALNQGYNLSIISGGTDEGVRARLQTLGIKDVILGAHKKMEHLQTYMNYKIINPEDRLYMGDDIPDYPVMKAIGLPCCPQDAVKEIKEVSTYISHKYGGEGCVRYVIEQVLKVHGKWLSDGNSFGAGIQKD